MNGTESIATGGGQIIDTLAAVAAQTQAPPTAFALCLILTLAIFSYHITAIAIGPNQ